MNLSLSTHPTACALIFSQTLLRGLRRCALSLAMLVFALLTTFAQAPAAGAQASPPPFVFASTATNGVPSITTYTVNPTSGGLTALATPPTPVNSPTGTGNLAVNPAGTFLFATSTNSAGNGTISVFSIAASGVTTELTASPFGISNASGTALNLVVSRDGKYLYVASQLGGATATPSALIDVFSIGPDGTPTVINSYTISPGRPVGLVLHPTGARLYAYVWYNPGDNDSGQPSSIQEYDVNADGTLTAQPPFDLGAFSSPGLSLTGSDDGAYLFAGHGMNGSVPSVAFLDAFFVNSVNGNLSLVSTFGPSNSPFPVGPQADTLAVESSSTYLFTNAGGFTFTNGILAALPTLTTALASASTLIASPTSPFLFTQLNNQAAGNVQPNMLTAELVNVDGSLTAAPSPVENVFAAGLAVTGIPAVPNEAILRTSSTTLPLGNVVVGQAPGTGLVNVTNWGFSPLVISDISLSGDPSFTETNTCSAPLAPMGTSLVTITFTPAATASSSSASSLIAPEFARLRATKITFAPLGSPLLALFVMLAIWLVMPASAASPRLRRTLRPLAMLAVLCLVAGCGGGGGSTPPPVTGTPAGTYRITITATSGTETAATIVTVVVQ